MEYLHEDFHEAPNLESGRRCWTLDYSGQFHMDILLSIPDDEGREKEGNESEKKILITDKNIREWQHCNPKGYANWFCNQMKVQFQEKRAVLARAKLRAQGNLVLNEEMIKEAAEEVPCYKVKTPLQRSIQILKRHRDFYFREDPDNRPFSIILTTLAAKSYGNEDNLVDALLKLVRGMPEHIEERSTDSMQLVKVLVTQVWFYCVVPFWTGG